MDLYVDNINQLLQARSEIDEELRRHKTRVTVFFTDVVGSTTYFDRFGDTAGLLLLHRHDNLVSTAVEEFHGMVVKTIGDSVMAEFPEPVLAVRAAIVIQQRLQEQNQNIAESERLRIRTGINYGPGFRRGNDLFGDAINLAARITKRGGPGQILISDAVRETLTETEICARSIGKVSLEGKAETEELHEVIWTEASAFEDLRPIIDSAAASDASIIASPTGRLDQFIQKAPAPAELSLATLASAQQSSPLDFPRYEILARIGVGGMGLVFKAKDRETGEIVALKVLKAEIADQPARMDAFKNELRLARKITHKNVCRIYDFNRTGSVSFISMEFVEGESLRRVLNRFNALSPRTGIKIARQICEGLREAHAQGIVHRDLKPENLMIDGAGNVKLMDFGLAHLVTEGSTAAGGTPSYMAPEQAQGTPLDQRCDIYALGLVLFEMFTGSAAFTGETPMLVALKQIQDAPANPRDIEDTIPEHVAKAILRCLEKEPAKRFQSIEELQAAILDESSSQRMVSRARKSVPWTAVILAVIAAILMVAAVIMAGRGASTNPEVDFTPTGAEFAAFHMAESLDNEKAWTAFLSNYGKGQLAPVAQERLEKLKSIAETKASAAVPIVPVPATRPKWPVLADTVTVSGGVFMMGNDDGRRDEKPRHQVQLDGFRISRGPITNRQYTAFLDETGRVRPKGRSFVRDYPDLPAVNVSYEEAVAFCKWASAKFGVAVRLPTEAEWEYGTRGRVNGNISEWVSDFYSRDYYSSSPVKNPTGPMTGSKRVVRGGTPTVQRRGGRDPNDHSDEIGFRIVVGSRP